MAVRTRAHVQSMTVQQEDVYRQSAEMKGLAAIQNAQTAPASIPGRPIVQRPLWQLVGSADRGSDKLLIDAVPLHEQGVATRFHDASAIHYVNHEVATI